MSVMCDPALIRTSIGFPTCCDHFRSTGGKGHLPKAHNAPTANRLLNGRSTEEDWPYRTCCVSEIHVAYGGKYRVEGRDLIVAVVNVPWNEEWNGTEPSDTFVRRRRAANRVGARHRVHVFRQERGPPSSCGE
jgi:hypothetical protein